MPNMVKNTATNMADTGGGNAAKQRVANEALNKLNSTTTKDISSAAVATGASKPATASKTNTIQMANNFGSQAKPAGTTPGSTGNNGIGTMYADREEADAAAAAAQKASKPQSLAEQYYSNPDRAASHTTTNTPATTGDGAATGNAGAAGNTGAGTGGSGSSSGGNSGGGSSGGSSGGSGSTPSGNGTQPTGEADTTEPEKSQEEQLRDAWAAAGEVTKRIVEGATPDEIDIDAIDKVDVNELESKLEQIRQIQEQRATGQVDYAVEQGVNDVNRAVEDAAPQFKTQRNQISADEQRALDNQVLYAEARGDRGGIGQSQYASIQNNAATNRYRVNQEQTKLSTDAARQIADLRAKGEFEKADSLLQISQNYLSELKALEQWALQTNLGVDEFNTQLEQWLANYNMSRDQYLINAEMSAANMTGAFSDGTPTLAARDKVENQLANAAQALFQLGLPLTDEQISALGWTKGQYTQYMNEQAVKKAAGGNRGGGYYNPVNNLNLTDDEVKQLQTALGVTADGLIGNNTRSAAGGYIEAMAGDIIAARSNGSSVPTPDDNYDAAYLEAMSLIDGNTSNRTGSWANR